MAHVGILDTSEGILHPTAQLDTNTRRSGGKNRPSIRELLLQLFQTAISGGLYLEIVGTLVVGKDRPINAARIHDILVCLRKVSAR